MGQKERDRLKVLHELSRGGLTQKQAAGQLKLSERQVRRMLKRFRQEADRAVLHRLAGRASNRRISSAVEQEAIATLSRPECGDFGPTYAAEYLASRVGIVAGKDTVRKWMMTAGLWQRRPRQLEAVHQWRERRACFGELVQWDTSDHNWLEGRGDHLYLIAMIDDATSRMLARFACRDTTEENMRVLWLWLEHYGRPLEFYTDKAGMFEVTPKRREAGEPNAVAMTQITRALAELGIHRSSAHSPQAKGRVERCFATAQDRLVKGLRLAGACTLEQANAHLEAEYLPEWNARWTVAPANATDAHRPLATLHNLAGSLSHVESRVITSDYTFQFQGERYQIVRDSVRPGMRGERLRVELRLDGSVAARYEGQYLRVSVCSARASEPPRKATAPARKDHNRGGRSAWMQNFNLRGAPSVWRAARDSNASS